MQAAGLALALVAETGSSIAPVASNLFEGKASLRIFDLAPWDSPCPLEYHPPVGWRNPPQGQEIEPLRHLLANIINTPIAILIDLSEDAPAARKHGWAAKAATGFRI
jgi:hypothetical protein